MYNQKKSLGITLIIIGSAFFLKNFVNIPFFSDMWNYFWPIALIVIGFQKISKK